MLVSVVTPPEPIVTLAQAKEWLAVYDSDSDVMIGSLIKAAAEVLDAPVGGWLGRALGAQTLMVSTNAWPCGTTWVLPYGPVSAIDEITYIDSAGVEQTYPVPDPLYFTNMPSVRGRPEDIKITYQSGYEAVPEPIRIAVLMHVRAMFDNRSVVTDTRTVVLPSGYHSLLEPYRIWGP